MPNFTAGTTFTDGVTNDVTAAKLNALVADAVPTSNLSLNSTTGTISEFSSGTGTAGTVAIGPSGDKNTGLFFPAADTIAFAEGGAEAMRIDSSGNVGIGETSPSFIQGGGLHIKNATRANLKLQDSTTNVLTEISTADNGVSSNCIVDIDPTNVGSGGCPLIIRTGGGTERLRIDSSGNVGIGVTSPSAKLDVNAGALGRTYLQYNGTSVNYFDCDTQIFRNASGTERLRIDSSGNVGIGGTPSTLLHLQSTSPSLRIQAASGNSSAIDFYRTASVNSGQIASESTNALVFSTNGVGNSGLAERLRIDSSGNLLVGKTSAGNVNSGFEVNANGRMQATVNGDYVSIFNRKTSDGVIVYLQQDEINEGSISVSGTTVSYNGGHLARFSQLPTGQRDESLKKGTVLSNLDAMCEWRDAEGNLLPNEQLNKVKVSDIEGDSNVAGVFVNWDNDDQDNPFDLNMAMTGDMIIRIAQGVTVSRGDLLMSAGDGTAKPQGDDIIKSKTVAKVTSTSVTCTYEDGSYCVPCVLMAC